MEREIIESGSGPKSAVSIDRDGRAEGIPMIDRLKNVTHDIISGGRYIPSLFLLTAVSMCLGMDIAGCMVLVFIAMWVLVFSDDTLAALCPVMFVVMGMTAFYDNYYVLLDYIWLTVPFAAALGVHIFAYRGPFVRGRFFMSLAAVSVALVLGGIGVIPAEEYFGGVSLYYICGLGFGLLLVYSLMCSRLSRRRDYDIVSRFAALVYAMALLAALIILLYYVRHWDALFPDFKTPFISYRNFCTTVMLFGLPMCCLFIHKKPIHLLGMAVIYFVMLIGGSRSALLFGTAELVLCLGYLYIRHPERRVCYRRIALACAIPAAIVGIYLIDKMFLGESGRFSRYFIRPDEARPSFYRQGVIDFLAQPLLGYGIGNTKNAGIYQGINGSIIFYHNSTLQVMASMGLVGCAAYLWQLVDRVRLLWEKRSTDAFLMAIPFIGITLMSQTNPGSFCPMPTALLLVVMFAITEFENRALCTEYAAERLSASGSHARSGGAVPVGVSAP